jgi:hypothetical protein
MRRVSPKYYRFHQHNHNTSTNKLHLVFGKLLDVQKHVDSIVVDIGCKSCCCCFEFQWVQREIF